MIAFLKGRLESVSEQDIVLECGGIGYRVLVSPGTASRLPPSGHEIKIYTHMHVKEDGLAIFGFLSPEEINIFNLLILVSGVGPKVAQGILNAMEPQQIMLAIITEDLAALGKAPGVGKKTAQRLVLELKDKLQSKDADMSDIVTGQRNIGMSTNEKQDAIDALLTLGYSRSEGVRAVMETALPGMSAEQIIKASLKKLVKG